MNTVVNAIRNFISICIVCYVLFSNRCLHKKSYYAVFANVFKLLQLLWGAISDYLIHTRIVEMKIYISLISDKTNLWWSCGAPNKSNQDRIFHNQIVFTRIRTLVSSEKVRVNRYVFIMKLPYLLELSNRFGSNISSF